MIDKEEIKKILELIQEAYREAGRELITAELYTPNKEEPEILIHPDIPEEELN